MTGRNLTPCHLHTAYFAFPNSLITTCKQHNYNLYLTYLANVISLFADGKSLTFPAGRRLFQLAGGEVDGTPYHGRHVIILVFGEASAEDDVGLVG